jgi:hypothetical protein
MLCSEKFSRYAVVVAVFAVQAVYTFVRFDGFTGGDDIGYAKAAKMLLDFEYPFYEHHHAHRLGLILPIAFMYRIFGINDFSSLIFPLVVQAWTLFALTFATRKFRFETFLSVLSVGGFDYYQLLYAGKVFPDTLVGLCVLLIHVCFSEEFAREDKEERAGNFSNKKHKKIISCLRGLAAGFFLFYAFMSKETILFALPFTAFLCLWALRKGFHIFIFSFALTSFLFFTAYFGFCYATSGDLFLRMTLTERNAYINPCSYHLYPEAMFRRLTYGFTAVLTDNGMMHPILTGLGSLFFLKKERIFPHVFGLGLLICFLSCQFLSISAKYYLPLCLDGRHFLLLIPLAAASSGVFFEKILHKTTAESKKTGLFFAAVALTACLSCCFLMTKNMSFFWAASCLFFLSCIVGIISAKMRMLLLFAVFLIRPAYSLTKQKESGHQNLAAVLKKNFGTVSEPTLIFTDPVLADSYDYFFAFEPPEKLHFANIENLDTSKLPEGFKIYFLLNLPQTEILRRDYGKKIPNALIKKHLKIKPKDVSGEVYLIEANPIFFNNIFPNGQND